MILALLLSVGWVGAPAAERDAKVAELRAHALSERVVAISEGFLGTPYVLSALGEGTGRDPDPRSRSDWRPERGRRLRSGGRLGWDRKPCGRAYPVREAWGAL